MEVRAILSVAKGLSWVEFSVSWVKVEVVVEIWVLGGCWAADKGTSVGYKKSAAWGKFHPL